VSEWMKAKGAADAAAVALQSRGIDEKYLGFSGVIPAPMKRPVVPTDARSEFLANRAMGDWAESIVRETINSKFDVAASHYGDDNSTAAGEDGFREAYLAALHETREFGKRPDLLLFERSVGAPDDLSALPRSEADAWALKSLGGLEIRSSKTKAGVYRAERARQAAAGLKPTKLEPSFTVKVEDLRVLMRWIEVNNRAQAYVQVFLDEVHAINVCTILNVIATGKHGRDFTIETPAKSQNKATIMVPISHGIHVGSVIDEVGFQIGMRETKLGRVDAYVVPAGGLLEMSEAKLLSSLD
jgi:hypothetical protein